MRKGPIPETLSAKPNRNGRTIAAEIQLTEGPSGFDVERVGIAIIGYLLGTLV